jgi:hypothetical protein
MSHPHSTASISSSSVSNVSKAAKVIIVSSVMFTFISYWRTAAVVLCDLASTAYYIGGIVEQAIGPAAPWLILCVMLFSYAVRSVYIESCSLFVRGGVYKVVKEAMGGFLAKLSVSALMFDYVLTGPISGVSAGQYIIGLVLDTVAYLRPELKIEDKTTKNLIMGWGSALIAILITLYFFRQNLIGIHESSDKAFKIMIFTTIMAVILIGWCGITLLVDGPRNRVPLTPDFQTKMNYDKDKEEDPLGFLSETKLAEQLRDRQIVTVTDDTLVIYNNHGEKESHPLSTTTTITLNGAPAKATDLKPGMAVDLSERDGQISVVDARPPKSIPWLSLIGLAGVFIAFGHSILAMSGEETLAQVYREVESPKLPNFKRAAFIVFVYSLLLTSLISFLAVMIIPNDVRMPEYSGNLIGGLAMNVMGPQWARLILNGLVVTVGFLILAGAVNTAIIGSNGVLNRVSEDGVMPDWFLKPHPRYGTSYRILYLIVGMQLFTILISQGNIILLGEAYAFGVVWSFVFKAMAMVVLRFRDRSPREFKVPLNIRVRGVEIPIGLSLIFLVLLTTAILNLLTKEVATISGAAFTAAFLSVFIVSEHLHEKKRKGKHHEHLEQFNQQATDAITPAVLGLRRPYRRLVAIRSPQNLQMLDKTLAGTDPATTDVIVMTAKLTPVGDQAIPGPALDDYDQHLMTAVVQHAEKTGKQVKPLIVPTNNPLYAVIRTAKDLCVQELTVGASNKYTADEQLDQIAFYWLSMHDGEPAPLTVRLFGKERDVHLDLAGGNRIPGIGERRARSVSELRAAGVGVDRVLLIHDNTPECSDLFQALLTMLDPQVLLGVVRLKHDAQKTNGNGAISHDLEQANQLGRKIDVYDPKEGDTEAEIARLARAHQYDLLVLSMQMAPISDGTAAIDSQALIRQAPCRVFLSAPQAIPLEPEQ